MRDADETMLGSLLTLGRKLASRIARGACSSAVLLALTAASTSAAQAQAASSYRYAAPPGWNQSIEGDIEALTPSDPQSQGQAQIMLLAPKPLAADFEAQFASERTALESFWGLRAPQAAPPQRGQSSKGPYGAYFASYASDGGDRYMSFLAIGSAGSFAMMVFVAASPDAFNRLAPVATQTFRTIEVVRR